MNKKIAVYIGFLIVVLAGLSYLLEEEPVTSLSINSFETCVEAGNPVMESYPRQCRTQSGDLFVEEIDGLPPATIPDYEETSDWNAVFDVSSGIIFQYPESLGATYIQPAAWPPTIEVTDASFTCQENETHTVIDTTYCVTEQSEGAAGSVYKLYDYSFSYSGGTAHISFALQFASCDNYPDEEKQQCSKELQAFNVDIIAHLIAQTLTIAQKAE